LLTVLNMRGELIELNKNLLKEQVPSVFKF
jgi:hypothetical protein